MQLLLKTQKELNQNIEKSKQSEFINQAVLFALKKIPKQKSFVFKEQINIKKDSEYFVYTDGGARGNPGIAGCGVVVFDKNNQKIAELKHFIPHATNNEAEYKALLLGVKKVLQYHPQKITFYLDSELIVKQMKGIYRVKKAELKEFYTQIKSLLAQISQVKFIHIPREKNTLADKLANQAMNTHK
jgi:ribonuclease HI